VKLGSNGFGEHDTGANRSVNTAACGLSVKSCPPKKQKGRLSADSRGVTGGEDDEGCVGLVFSTYD
jgi:hypothetical protein